MLLSQYSNKTIVKTGIAIAAISLVCPPAIATAFIAVAAKAIREKREVNAKEKATISRCETQNSGSKTIGFVYNGEVR